MRSASLIVAAALLSLSALSSGAAAQEVMARGYYNHIESRVSTFIPGVTSVDQVAVEKFSYGPMEDGPMIDSAYRLTHNSTDGTRYQIQSVDFATPEVVALGNRYGKDGTLIKTAMTHAAANYRKMGEVLYDAGTVVEFIPAHILNLRLPNGRLLFVL